MLLADRYAGTNVEVATGSAAELPYPDAGYDSVGCFTMLHHVPTLAAGHIGPLLQSAPAVVTLVTAFWHDPQATIAKHRSPADHEAAGEHQRHED